ncbi:MAG: hypothetical protein IT364_00335 [Candidatus Hydrogenedentes bacterium]|nr:hypothetical protein [Candidatus Hydrogenedentota bacterium]
MSSILDALKKLEQDKQEKEQSDQLEIGTEAAERDLFHHKRGAGRGTIQVSSMVLVGGVLVFAVALVCVSVITALLIVNAAPVPPTATAQAANATALSVNQVAPGASAPVEPASPDPVSVAPATPAVEPARPAGEEVEPAPPPEPPIEVPRPEQPSVQPKEEILLAAAQAPASMKPVPIEEPAPRVQHEIPPAPRPQPSVASQIVPPAPAKSEKPDPAFGDIDLNVLPILSESERVRLGLPPLEVNIVGLPTKRQPRPSALINYEKVYVGEYISNTNARLVDVELRGVGLSVGGQLYFLPK